MRLSLVVPVYNEQENISRFIYEIENYHELKKYEIEIVFVNDGSRDSTLKEILKLREVSVKIIAIDLVRNFGKEAALMAGLSNASGELIIPIDVDLQDPINVIPQLVERWKSTNADTVLAKRVDRSNDSYFKKTSAKWFYKLHNKISNEKIEENVGDFRLITRDILDIILNMPEKNLFMKGLLSWPCGNVEIVEYKRGSRDLGQTKFNGLKLWSLALEGITSFSSLPLKIWTYVGFMISILAFFYGSLLIFNKIYFGISVNGYASLMVSILFLGGCQLIGIGILGEYVGRIFIETKSRPRFVVRKIYNVDK